MVSSAIFRRCIFSPFRRMISSSAPWLMLSEYGSPCKFYSIENNLLHILYSSEYSRRRRWRAPESPMDEEIAGSSDGWLARYNSRNHNLSLVNPATNRLIKLPTVVGGGPVHHVIAREKEGFALMTLGCGGGLAFCSPWDTNKWTMLEGGERLYDSVIYSTKHHSLFCISDDKRFQVWDFGVDGVPRLESDWIMDLDSTPISSPILKRKLAYVICAEHMGVLFLVVRHLRINRGPEPNYFPFKTDSFEVYEIDLEQQRVGAARDSLLQGLVMFVGINEPLAIPAVEVPSLKPGSVYFTYDRRLRCTKDMGVFDFQKREVSRFSTLIQQTVFSPLWFSPQMSSI